MQLGLFDEDVKPTNVSICNVSPLDTDFGLVLKKSRLLYYALTFAKGNKRRIARVVV
jgi:hypothetical protein